MVMAVTNFGRSGLHDWMYQRISAVVLLAYTVYLAYFLLSNSGLSYVEWQQLFSSNWMRAFSLLAVLSLVVHAWVGLWSVTTDYITNRTMGGKATGIRFVLQSAAGLVAFYYVIWMIQILWGL